MVSVEHFPLFCIYLSHTYHLWLLHLNYELILDTEFGEHAQKIRMFSRFLAITYFFIDRYIFTFICNMVFVINFCSIILLQLFKLRLSEFLYLFYVVFVSCQSCFIIKTQSLNIRQLPRTNIQQISDFKAVFAISILLHSGCLS